MILRTRDLAVSVGLHKVCLNLDLDLAPGSRLAILGRNGAGKSTLLATLAGLREADAGTCLLAGRRYAEWGPRAAARLRGCELRVRSGGERFQATPGGRARSLKKQFQAAGVPAWQRHAPLLYDRDGHLLWVPGLGVDARALAPATAPQWRLVWLPATAGG